MRFSAADREKLIKEHAASGLTKATFCRERGISVGTFYSWRDQATEGVVSFAAVELPPVATAPIEVDLPNGVQIRVNTVGDVDRTAALIRQVIHSDGGSC